MPKTEQNDPFLIFSHKNVQLLTKCIFFDYFLIKNPKTEKKNFFLIFVNKNF